MAQALELLDRCYHTYFDRGYNSGGVAEIVAGDLTADTCDVATLTEVITMTENVQAFVRGTGGQSADYTSTMNKARFDV
jgi:hypothetical protein